MKRNDPENAHPQSIPLEGSFLLLDSDAPDPKEWTPPGDAPTPVFDEALFAARIVAGHEAALAMTEAQRTEVLKVVSDTAAIWTPSLTSADLTPPKSN